MAKPLQYLRFQLKHWFMLVAAVSCPLAYVAILRTDLQATNEALRQARMHGGSVDVHYAPDTAFSRWESTIYGGPVPQEITVQFQRRRAETQSWGAWGLRGETVELYQWNQENIPRLRTVLRQLSALQGLSFWDAEMPKGLLMEIVPYNPRLKWLQLSGTLIQGRELQVLSRVPNLESLQLDTTNITDADMHLLAHLSKLESLSLHNTRITDDGLKLLAHLKISKRVRLDLTRITPKVIPVLVAWQPTDEVLLPAEWPAEAEVALSSKLPRSCRCSRSSSEFRFAAHSLALQPEKNE
jgi:Leucine rich repeat